jgi:hypothetical protein
MFKQFKQHFYSIHKKVKNKNIKIFSKNNFLSTQSKAQLKILFIKEQVFKRILEIKE